MYTPTDMEVFRICTLISRVGMVFFTEGLARSYGGGVGMSTVGFPSPLQSVAGGGVHKYFGKFRYPKKCFPPMRDLPGRSSDKPEDGSNKWTRLLAIRIRERADRRNRVDLRSSATCSPTNRWLVILPGGRKTNRRTKINSESTSEITTFVTKTLAGVCSFLLGPYKRTSTVWGQNFLG